MRYFDYGKGAQRVWGEEFETFAELMKAHDQRPLAEGWKRGWDDHVKRREDIGVRGHEDVGFEGSRDMLLNGTDAFDAMLREARGDLDGKLRRLAFQDVRPRTRPDVTGSAVNVPRALMGHPRSMSRRVPGMRGTRNVSLLYDVTTPWTTDGETRARVGLAVFEVARRLEAAGYSVELLVASTFTRQERDGVQMLLVPVKSYSSPLVPRKMAFPFISGTYLWHVGCTWADRFAKGRCWGEGFGRAAEVNGMWDRVERFAEERGSVALSLSRMRYSDDPVGDVVDEILEASKRASERGRERAA